MPITFLTDPKNTDYEMESGGTRNYEVWKDKERSEEQIQKDREEEDKKDSMRALENRVLDSQREMAELDALDEIKAMNMRHAKLGRGGFDVTEILNSNTKAIQDGSKEVEEELNENGLTESEEALVSSIKFGKVANTSVFKIRRLNEDDEEQEKFSRNERKRMLEEQQDKLYNEFETKSLTQKNKAPRTLIPIVKKVKKKGCIEEKAIQSKSKNESISIESGGLNSLIGGYGSSDDSE